MHPISRVFSSYRITR